MTTPAPSCLICAHPLRYVPDLPVERPGMWWCQTCHNWRTPMHDESAGTHPGCEEADTSGA